MCICMDPITHVSYTIPISNLVHEESGHQLEDKAGQKTVL